MRKNIILDPEQKMYRDKFVRQVYHESEMSLEKIGGIFKLSKQLVSIILKQKKS